MIERKWASLVLGLGSVLRVYRGSHAVQRSSWYQREATALESTLVCELHEFDLQIFRKQGSKLLM